jgi:NAD(P)-dependent dehydrogenase (short-subunit alcohol dehydrogenase family)
MGFRPFDADLSDQVALVTGANSGMGKETARELVRMGSSVVLGCRSRERGEAAAAEIRETTERGSVHVIQIDLASLASVRAFASEFSERFPKLDVLVNNAAASLRVREVTPDGFEAHWATNVLGPHLLTTLLLPALERSGDGRIVTVSTVAAGGLDLSDTQYERRRFTGVAAYRASKQASRMLTWALADRLKGTRVTANALNPGYVLTDLTLSAGGPVKLLVRLTRFAAQSPLDGADTAIWLAASPAVQGATGKFWNKRREARCRFRDPSAVQEVASLVERQLAEISRPTRRPESPGGRSGTRS